MNIFFEFMMSGSEHNFLSEAHPSGRWWAMGIFGAGDMELRDIGGQWIARVPISLNIGGMKFDAAGNLFTSTRTGLYRWPVQGDPTSGWTIGPPQRQPSFDSPIFAISADGQKVLRYSSDSRVTLHPAVPPFDL